MENGRLVVNCQPLGSMIRMAYLRFADGKPPARNAGGFDLEPVSMRQMEQAITGAPAWLEHDTYTIEAKSETPQPMPMMRGPMLQALLEDRFRLKLHRESRDVQVYALTVGKGGAKVTPPEAGKCITVDEVMKRVDAGADPGAMPWICGAMGRNNQGEVSGYRVTMADLARDLSRMLDHDVVDRTGIAEPFDLHMQLAPADALAGLSVRGAPAYAADPNAPSDPPGASVFPAVARLGLKLELSKAPAGFLVIDHVERPTGN